MEIVSVGRRGGKTTRLVEAFLTDVRGSYVLVADERRRLAFIREVIRAADFVIDADLIDRHVVTPIMVQRRLVGSGVVKLHIDDIDDVLRQLLGLNIRFGYATITERVEE